MLTNVQLGLYQLAVDHGAAEELAEEARAGGAELVQLGLPGDATQATVQHQPDQADEGPERAALRGRLERAASLLRTESFPVVIYGFFVWLKASKVERLTPSEQPDVETAGTSA